MKLRIAFILLLPTAALAGRRTPCDSCESCTEALAKEGAEVELSADLVATAEVCVRVAGAKATFNGKGFGVTAHGVGIEVAAPDVFLRRPKVSGGAVGVRVAAARTTILGAEIGDTVTAIRADAAPGLRIVRSSLKASGVGLALGQPEGGVCPESKVTSSGVVLRRVEISGAQVGVAACAARPVIMDSTLTGNGVGLLQGDPKGEAATDPCVCGATLPGTSAGTTLFFSSGCGGCKIHEGFLPDVHARGHDVLLRQTGKEHAEATAAYDAFVRRCAPEITDAIGVPGCVPNYACPASGEVAKRRGPGDRLEVEHSLTGADAVSEFAARCVAAASARFGEGCPTAPLIGNTLCHNSVDVAGRSKGVENACGTVEGDKAALGCTAACPPAPATPPPAAPTTAAAGPGGDDAPATASMPTWAPIALGGLIVVLGGVWWRLRRGLG